MKNCKTITKKAFAIILTAILIPAAAAGAWFVISPNLALDGNGISAVPVKAAGINAEYSIDIQYYIGEKECGYGVPGEKAVAKFTLEDLGSTRDYVYKIDIKDTESFVYQNGEIKIIGNKNQNGGVIIGEVNFPKTGKVIDGVYYGLMKIGDDKTNIDIVDISLVFYGKSVGYDGNLTMDYKFDFSKIKVECCQATPAAVMDYFKLKLKDAQTLCGLGGG